LASVCGVMSCEPNNLSIADTESPRSGYYPFWV
jgi:hypothetical protein